MSEWLNGGETLLTFTVSGGSAATRVELTFASPSKTLVSDVAIASATTASRILCVPSLEMPSPYSYDEHEMDPIVCSAYCPTDGTVRILVSVADQRSSIVGPRVVDVTVAAEA